VGLGWGRHERNKEREKQEENLKDFSMTGNPKRGGGANLSTQNKVQNHQHPARKGERAGVHKKREKLGRGQESSEVREENRLQQSKGTSKVQKEKLT